MPNVVDRLLKEIYNKGIKDKKYALKSVDSPYNGTLLLLKTAAGLWKQEGEYSYVF